MITLMFTLGGELYYHTADSQDGQSDAGESVGGFVNLNEHNHILFSIGHNLLREGIFTGYVGYQVTL
ncbi:MAG: hypothetical protein ACHQQQ_10045 [Bacteroidota bacterium]